MQDIYINDLSWEQVNVSLGGYIIAKILGSKKL